MHQARTFGNDSCPATRFTKGYTDSRQHTFCYAPYATGELGANITTRLGLCCNGTANQSQAAPIEVVRDPIKYELPVTGDCWFSCNATYLEGERAVGGELSAFSDLERCLQKPVDDGQTVWNGSEVVNPYHIVCTPRETRNGSGTLVPQGASKLGFSLLALIIIAVIWG